VVDESDVFGGARDDNDDFLQVLINVDLPGRDLQLSVWKLLAIAALSFTGVPTLLEYIVQAAWRYCTAYVASLCFIYFRCVHLDVVSVLS
jgi:hypothetical protein